MVKKIIVGVLLAVICVCVGVFGQSGAEQKSNANGGRKAKTVYTQTIYANGGRNGVGINVTQKVYAQTIYANDGVENNGGGNDKQNDNGENNGGVNDKQNDNGENGGQIALPVIMYHSLSKNKAGDYTVTVKQFEDDLAGLLENGYTTVFGREVVAYLDGVGELPVKPVMIVFDDGHYNNVKYGEPILQKYGAKAIINVVGKYIDETERLIDKFYEPTSYLTWQHIREINKEIWEIGSHTYDMHNYRPRFGVGRRFLESEEKYLEVLKADNEIMTEKLRAAGIETNIFAFPFGKSTETAVEFFTGAGYKILFSCREKVNFLPLPKTEKALPIVLNRFNRRGGYATTTLLHKFG
jgi:peptidoglycan/xylan/chitin deacetylase (PgdA/CDA1 family)